MRNTGFVIAVGALALIGGFVIMNQQSEANKVTQPSVQGAAGASANLPDTSQSVSALNPVEPDDSSVNTIEVEMGSFYYKPNMISITRGEKVRLILKSVSMMHDFNVDELGVKSEIIKDGDTGTVEFTPDKAGTFEYYCSVGEHRANGQVGTLVVKE